MENKSDKLNYIKKTIISLAAGYLITLAGILILAILLFMLQISEDIVDIGIIVIYVLSSFGAGFLAGKQLKTKKFLWGMMTGVLYYVILIFISVTANQSLASQGQELISSFLLCFGGGTLGGMVS